METRKITIEIKSKQGTTPPADPQKPKESEDKATPYAKESVGRSVVINQALEMAKRSVLQTAEAMKQRYFALADDYIGERNYNQAKAIIEKTVGLGTAVIGGAQIGGWAGAIIGMGGWAMNNAIQIITTQSMARISIANGNYERDFAQMRAGLYDGGRGTEN